MTLMHKNIMLHLILKNNPNIKRTKNFKKIKFFYKNNLITQKKQLVIKRVKKCSTLKR